MPDGQPLNVAHADIDVALFAPQLSALVSRQWNRFRYLRDIEIVGQAQFFIVQIVWHEPLQL